MHPQGLYLGAALGVQEPYWHGVVSNTFQTFASVYTLISSAQIMDYVCIKICFLGPSGGFGTPGVPLGPPDPIWYGVSQAFNSLVFEQLKSQIIAGHL